MDDTPTNLEVICEALSDAGLEVAIANSGERALQQIAREKPDLILLDVMMPGIDGFETCRRLKLNAETCDIPIIFMTALSDTDNKVKALELGAVDYVTKPFQEREVLARVKTHLQLRRLTQNLEQEVQQKAKDLQNSQLQLIQSEKMSVLGNLVAGVAHEINNPLGFLNGSIGNAKEYVRNLLGHLALYQQHHPDAADPVQKNAVAIDLAFLCEDLPKLLDSMAGATDRISNISNSLRTFSRADTEHKVNADLHEGIDSTLLILKYRLKANEYRPEIEVIRDYGELPLVQCFPGQLNQVFMNILANAIDVFDEMAQIQPFDDFLKHPQQITIRTRISFNQVEVCIQDNGKGMTADVREKIFDHLFTTKGVGRGTGLGLAIARQIVAEKHGGSLKVQSELGQGTEFCICLPIEAEP
ncbi:MAG: response regulator [Synechococcales bacterium]|nr:response regulator [Synechococcales bacterium]